MRDLSRPLEECLQAVKEKRNLQQVLRRYPADRDELIGMLRLSVELSAMGAPAAEPAFRLRARNRMLQLAAERRQARQRNPFGWVPRPATRLAFAGAMAIGLVAAGVTAAAASGGSLPGDPLYGLKLGIERAQLAVTLDSAQRARLQLHFADVRLEEAQRLFGLGRDRDAVALVSQYDAQVSQFNHAVAASAFDDGALTELSRLVQERQANADASLNALAGSLNAHGDSKSAAIVAQTQTHVDAALKVSKTDLEAHASNGRQDSHGTKPAGGSR